jgi:hypothetical protein
VLVLNYAHPLSAEQIAQLEALLGGQYIGEVRTIPTQLDVAQPFVLQTVALAEAAGLSASEWQTRSLLIVLPALNYAAAALLAHLHGRMGYFPPVVRLRPVAGAIPPRFEIAEVLNLQEVREKARMMR